MKRSTSRKGNKIRWEADVRPAAALLCALCCIICAFIATDSKKYKNDEQAGGITYTEPEEAREQGFWDIFTGSIAAFFETAG